jgi:hypothetical protein
VRAWVILLESPNPLQKFLSPPLLEKTHQRTPQRLARITWNLGDRRLGVLALLGVAARNLLEFEISRDVGRDEDIGELAIGHEQLRHEVDVPVIGAAVGFPGLGA